MVSTNPPSNSQAGSRKLQYQPLRRQGKFHSFIVKTLNSTLIFFIFVQETCSRPFKTNKAACQCPLSNIQLSQSNNSLAKEAKFNCRFSTTPCRIVAHQHSGTTTRTQWTAIMAVIRVFPNAFLNHRWAIGISKRIRSLIMLVRNSSSLIHTSNNRLCKLMLIKPKALGLEGR